MKKLLLAATAIVALTMLAPVAGFAEPTHPNEIGLYTTPDGYGDTGTFDVGTPVIVYLVLTKPTVLTAGRSPASTVVAFDCQLNFNPIGGIFKLGDSLAADGLNIGDSANISNGYLEYIVGFSFGVPVVDETAMLITFTFLNTNAGPVEVTLGPASVQSIEGEMSFYPGAPFDLQIMHSVAGGSHDAPVFIFNGQAIAVENESFGSVKALYR